MTISSGVISPTSCQTGLSCFLGEQVPDGIDHGAGGKVHRALVRADPAQLAVAGDEVPEAAGIFLHPIEFEADDQMLHRLDREAADLIAAADREGQAVAG